MTGKSIAGHATATVPHPAWLDQPTSLKGEPIQ